MTDAPPEAGRASQGAVRPWVVWPLVALVTSTMLTLVGRIAALASAAVESLPEGLGQVFLANGSVAALATFFVLLVALVGKLPGARRRPFASMTAAATGIALWPAFLLTSTLAAGDWIAQQSFAPLLRFSAPLVALVAAAALAAAIHHGARRLWVGAPVLVMGTLACVADAFVLPGLYDAFHVAAYLVAATAFAVATAVAFRAVPPDLSDWRGAPGLVALALAGLLAARSTEVRAALASAAPTLSLIASPLRTEEQPNILLSELDRIPLGEGATTSTPVAPKARVRSVLLVIVDTLRADVLPPLRTDGSFIRPGDTPRLDAWLEQTIRFNQNYSQASQTKHSLPAFFRALEPFEDANKLGTALPEAMKRVGVQPIAVVPQYFLMPAAADSQRLLVGFESVGIYEKDEQKPLVEQATKLLEEAGQRPFFAWVHFYGMHDPYYADRPLKSSDGSARDRYRKALRYLDREFGRLVDSLDRLGLASSTAVVFASDHGEFLGEGKRHGHGGGVRELEIRVPLAVRVPGEPGRVVSPLTGNIDIVPTIFELLGIAPDPMHRGRSLLGIARAEDGDSPDYYVQNGKGTEHAILDEKHKLVFREQDGTLSLYDRSDSNDTRDLVETAPAVRDRLLSTLVRRNPAVRKDELTEPDVRARLIGKLRDLGPSTPRASASFLIQLAALARAPELDSAVRDAFARDLHPDVRAEIIERFYPLDTRTWDPLLGHWVDKIADGPIEPATADALARRGVPAFASASVIRRVQAACSAPASACESWLRVIETWKKPAASYAPPLRVALQSATVSSSPQRPGTLQVLRAVATMERATTPTEDTKALEETILSLLSDPNPVLATTATRALGRVGSASSAARAEEILFDKARDPRIRQAALHALVELSGREAVPSVVRAGDDPLLVADAIQILGRLRDGRARDFLERISKEHYNGWTRGEARKALKALRGGS